MPSSVVICAKNDPFAWFMYTSTTSKESHKWNLFFIITRNIYSPVYTCPPQSSQRAIRIIFYCKCAWNSYVFCRECLSLRRRFFTLRRFRPHLLTVSVYLVSSGLINGQLTQTAVDFECVTILITYLQVHRTYLMKFKSITMASDGLI